MCLYVNIARVMHPSTLHVSGRRYVTYKALPITINTFKNVTMHTIEILTWHQFIKKFQHSLK